MTRNLVFLTTVASIAIFPQIAQASCSGNACSSVSATATWSSSDKRANTVLTNKDQSQAMHLKLCITVDGKCNSFEITLPPRGSTTKSVTVSGGAAPPKFAVDVNNADFPVVQGASPSTAPSPGSAAASSSGSAAVNGVDTPYGRISYFATQQSLVGPLLTRGVADFTKAKVSYDDLASRVIKLRDGAQKIGSLKDIESVRRDHAGLHSFLSMSLIEARRRNASAFRLRFSQSLARRLHRPSHANVRSTTQRFGRTTNPFA